MEVAPYVNFNGNGLEALNYYATALGGTVSKVIKFGDMKDQPWVTDDIKDRLAHGTVRFGNFVIMASDTCGSKPHKGFEGVSISTSWPTVEEGRAAFEKMGAGGEVVMPFGKTSWAGGFGMCRDKFGVQWSFNADAQECG